MVDSANKPSRTLNGLFRVTLIESKSTYNMLQKKCCETYKKIIILACNIIKINKNINNKNEKNSTYTTFIYKKNIITSKVKPIRG